MLEVQDTLLGYAEVAIAIAGFSAIVIVLRGGGVRWQSNDAHKFHGMLVHAAAAAFFCLLPTVLNVVVQDPVTTLRIACAVLGVQTIAHAVGVLVMLERHALSRWMLLFGALVGLLQFAVFTDWGIHREFEFYQVGITWHVLQAGALFVMLVWIGKENIDD